MHSKGVCDHAYLHPQSKDRGQVENPNKSELETRKGDDKICFSEEEETLGGFGGTNLESFEGVVIDNPPKRGGN